MAVSENGLNASCTKMSEMAKHTPGPWEWFNRDRLAAVNTAGRVLEFREDPEGWKAGWIACSDEDRALIAAAPDLLALVLAVEWVPDPGDMGDPDYCPWCYGAKPNHSIACPRQAAIAKAKPGQSPIHDGP